MKMGLIGSLMLQQGLIRPDELERAQRIQKQRGGSLDEILIATGILTEAEFQRFLADMTGLPYYSLDELLESQIDRSLLEKLSYRMCMTHLILPLQRTDSHLFLVAQSPLKREVKVALLRKAGVEEVDVALSTREDLLDAIRFHYGSELARRATQRPRPTPEPLERIDSADDISTFALQREGFCPDCGTHRDPLALECGKCKHQFYEPDKDPYVGQILGGRWQLQRQISQGGMGMIYAALDLDCKRKVAVKLLRNQFRTSSLEIQRFNNEARFLQQLHHDHVVETYEFGYQHKLGFFLAMELLEGKDLFEYQFRLALPTPLLCAIFAQVCDAMAHAHQMGIIHRDIKPENIFLVGGVEHFQKVKVLDFGIAKLVQGGRSLTTPGIVMGTPEYIAPEQAQNGAIDHRTDIYALSVIFYEFLCGQRLFEAETAYSYLLKHVYARPLSLSSRASREIPEVLEELIMMGLEKRPSDRIPTMEAYRDALLQIQAQLEGDTAFDGYEGLDDATETRPIYASALPHAPEPLLPLPAHTDAYSGAVRPFAAQEPPHETPAYFLDGEDPAAAPTQPEPLPEFLYEHATVPVQAIESADHVAAKSQMMLLAAVGFVLVLVARLLIS